MNCTFIHSNIQSYIDKTIDDNHAVKIERHLDQCASCKKEYQSLKKMIVFLHDAEYPKVNEDEWQAMHRSIIFAISSQPQRSNVIAAPRFKLFTVKSIPMRALAALIVVTLISLSFLVVPSFVRNQELFSSPNSNYPKIVAIDGNAFSIDAATDNSSSPVSVKSDATLPPGRSIRTDDHSSLQIQVDKQSTILLGRNSHFSVSDCAAKKTVFKLKNGDIAAHVSKRQPDQLFRIETPNAFCEVIGTRFNVTTQHDDFRNRFITTLTVHEGIVLFGSPDHNLHVKAGESIAIFGDSLGTPTILDDSLIQQLQQMPGMAHFTITSIPSNAQVMIDGVPCGFTPYISVAPFGTHIVNCSKNGFKMWSGILQIDANLRTELVITLHAGTKQTKSTTTSVLAETDVFNNPVFCKANELIIAGSYKDALAQLKQLIDNQSITSLLRANALNKASMCLKRMGNYEGALAMLQQIIDGNFSQEQRGSALFERATIHQSLLHDSRNAISDFQRYTREFSSGIWAEEACYSLGELLYSNQDYKQAAQTYQNCCDTYKESSRREKVLYTLGTIYSHNLSDPGRALNTYTRLLLEFPYSQFAEDAVFWSADCLFRLGNTSRALKEFTTYSQRYPNGKWAAEVHVRLKRIETAEAH